MTTISTSLRATHAELLACDPRIEDWDYLLDALAEGIERVAELERTLADAIFERCIAETKSELELASDQSESLRGERDELNLVLKNVTQEVQEIRRQAAIDAAHGGETNNSSAKMAEQILTHLDAALGPDRVRIAKDEDAALDEAYAKMNDELIKQRDSMTSELGKALWEEHMPWDYLIGFAESIRGAVNACPTREELATQLADVEHQLAESKNRLDDLQSRIIAVRDHIAEAGNPTSGKVVIEMLDELVEEGEGR